MTRELFFKLYHDAQAQPDCELYIGEYGYPDYFDEISDNPDEIVEKLQAIHRAANMTMKKIIKAAGMTQKSFAKHFDIPLRTVESWCMGDRRCPDYVRLMILELLGIVAP